MSLPYDQQAALEAVIGALYHLQSPPGPYGKRYYSLIFRDLPDREEYPDYYLIIKEPRALNDISESLRHGRYRSPQGVAYDLFRIWSNAREYNQQGSQVYADADTLEQYMRRVWQERSPPLPPFDSLPRPGTIPAVNQSMPTPSASESERKVKRIKLTGASLGGSSTKIRLGGPSTPAPAPSPATATPGITLKLGGRTAASNLGTPAALPSLPPLNLPNLPPPPPVPSTSALASPGVSGERGSSAVPTKKESKKKRKQQSVDPDGDGEGVVGNAGPPIATVPDLESGWMANDNSNSAQLWLNILNKLRSHTDANGRILATPLLDLPDRASRPDYYQLIRNPVALSTIEAKIRSGAYPNSEAFDRDLHHLFETAKVFIRPETPGTIYSDLLVLQRLYHELTKRDAQLEAAVNATIAAGPVPGLVKREENATGEVGKATSRPTTKDKVFLDGINLKGDFLRVGDWIYLSNSRNPGKPIVAQIWQTYRRAESSERYVSVCWYYRPEETMHPATRMFYENEVFKTSIFIDHHVEEFVGRCCVMYHTRYKTGRPKPPSWTPDVPLYICEYRYKDEAKSFKKIKNWPSCIPEQIRAHEYDFEPFASDNVDAPIRIKSPFVRGVVGTGGVQEDEYSTAQNGIPSTTSRDVPSTKPVSMDLDVQPIREDLRKLGSAEPSNSSFGVGIDPSLGNFDASLLAAPSPAFLAPSTPTAAGELDTTDFFTPLPSALKSKFRNDALGDLLWFGAPAISPPLVNKPTHSLAYLYWRVRQQREAADS